MQQLLIEKLLQLYLRCSFTRHFPNTTETHRAESSGLAGSNHEQEPGASVQEDEAAADLAQDVHGHRRPPLALHQLEEADVVVEEAIVADEAAPAAAGEATGEPVAGEADVPLPLAADPPKDDVPTACSQVLGCKL
jgi:hypothetical protein